MASKITAHQKNILKKILLIGLSLTGWCHAASGFYRNHAEGWFWYQHPAVEESPTELPVPSSEEPITLENASEKLDALRKIVDSKRDLAIMLPCGKNILSYLVAQKALVKKASVFQETWDRELSSHPELDYEIERPSSTPARKIYEQEQLEKRSAHLLALSNKHILILFSQPNCRYCEVMANTLIPLKEIFTIIEIEAAEQPSKEGAFLYKNLKTPYPLRHTPTLVMYSPTTEVYTPLFSGTRTLDKIMDMLQEVSNEI